MKRNYPSGAEKRKKIIAKKAAEERGKRTLDCFLLPNANLVTDRLGDPSPSTSQCLVPDLYNRGEAETILVPKQQEISSVEDNNKTDEDSFDVLTTANLDSEKTIDESEQINVNKDPGTWGRLDIKTRDLLVLAGLPGKPQGIPRDNSGRPFPTSILSKKLSNGESADRDWISWSIEKSAFFCYPCCLFEDRSIENKQLSNFVKCGVSDNWKKIYDRVKDHESNVNHVNNYVKWKELVITLKGKKSGIDDSLLKCIREEEEKWRRILTAVIDVILFLAERNLPFRGTSSTVDKDDCGIFLSTLKLLGRYNSDIKDHLDSLARAKESGKKLQAHYLSWRTQNEFLKVCGDKVKSSIIREVQESLYFSIIVDGTPDISHKEQLVFVIRYISRNDGLWGVYERFLQLSDFDQKTGEAIANKIKIVLKDSHLDLQLCRGQAYDNASNMSGKFKGVKTRILNDNPQAYFSPCGAHSLNLCGVHAMEVSTEVKSYFGNVQKLYKTFSMSPSRWKILQTTTGVSLHSVSTTRWSARVDAIRPLTKRYQDIIHALVSISDETNLPPETQADVDALITWMNSFEFVLFTTIWYKTLKVIDERNKVLQNSKITVKDSAKIMEGLISDIATIRSSWDKFLEESKSIASTFLISPEFKPTRGRKKKTFFDDSEVPDHSFNVTDRFKVEVFLPSIDLLSLEIKSITEKMKELSDVFTPIISPTENTLQLNQLYVDGVAEDLVNGYPRDLTKDELANELTIYFKLLKDGVINSGEGNLNCAVDILNNIYQKGLEHILPQICICLRLLAVIPVSVSTGERAFSKMALIKNRLRSAMGEDRLNHLMILSIEHDIVRKISFDEVIEDFARLKARKVKL